MEEITNLFGISNYLVVNTKKAEEDIAQVIKEIENVALYNQAKVMKAFKDYQVSRNALFKDNWLWI